MSLIDLIYGNRWFRRGALEQSRYQEQVNDRALALIKNDSLWIHNRMDYSNFVKLVDAEPETVRIAIVKLVNRKLIKTVVHNETIQVQRLQD